MIKSRLPRDTQLLCTRCNQPLPTPYILWRLHEIDLYLCVPCADLVGRGLFHDVSIIQDIQGQPRERKQGQRAPMNTYQPAFKDSNYYRKQR